MRKPLNYIFIACFTVLGIFSVITICMGMYQMLAMLCVCIFLLAELWLDTKNDMEV